MSTGEREPARLVVLAVPYGNSENVCGSCRCSQAISHVSPMTSHVQVSHIIAACYLAVHTQHGRPARVRDMYTIVLKDVHKGTMATGATST